MDIAIEESFKKYVIIVSHVPLNSDTRSCISPCERKEQIVSGVQPRHIAAVDSYRRTIILKL
jgi:hypothetical protein